MTETNPYCETEPYQLRVWDQTALAGFMHCPRYYWLAQVQGWRPNGNRVDLDWGGWIHEGADVYIKALMAGASPESATELALGHVLSGTETDGGKDCFGGFYAPVWQCTDRTRTVSKKGIKRCPWSYKEHLADGSEADDYGNPMCPKCHRPAILRTAYICEEKVKNRRTLARSLVALCDAFAKSSLKPKRLSDGRIGSEIRWFRELSVQSPDGMPYLMTGSFDQVAEEAGRTVIPELKTTRKDPNEGYYAQHSTGVQVHTYAWAADAQFPGESPKMLLAVIHVTATNTEIYFRTIRISPGSLAEWERDIGFWISFSEDLARNARLREEQGLDPAEAFPRRLTACNGMPSAPTTPCPLRDICRLDPSDRELFLAGNFHKDPWSPIGVKGAQ